MKRFIIHLAVPLAIALMLPGCRLERNAVRRVCITQKQDQLSQSLDIDASKSLFAEQKGARCITIWIHGTQLFAQKTFQALFNEQAQLKHFATLPSDCDLRTIADILIHSAPRTFIADDFYIFGWSGLLSFAARDEAAKSLYREIQRLQMEYCVAYGYQPYIRLITHSHGGNVALNMAKLSPPNGPHFYIDQLILLACPVQEHTKHDINHQIFKQSYSLYSRLDLMQIIDPQGLYGPEGLWRSAFLSERRFPSDQRVHQIKIKMHKRAITHHEFILPAFLEQLAIVINEIDIWQQQKSFNIHKNKEIRHLISIGTGSPRARSIG